MRWPTWAVALYGALLTLAGPDLRLLEIGASAGLNLHADRFAYRVGGKVLGDPSSPLGFEAPWEGVPVPDPAAAAAALRIVDRAGSDPSPIDAATPGGRLALESYVWSDEQERLQRQRDALEVAAAHPVALDRTADTAAWLREQLTGSDPTTVLWSSVVRQYVHDAAWAAVESVVGQALSAGTLAAWITFEPTDDRIAGFALRLRDAGGERELARCGDHGPPVCWSASSHAE